MSSGSARAVSIGTGGSTPARSRERRDPLALMLGGGMGERWDLVAIAVAVALSLHGAMVGPGVAHGLLRDVRMAVDENRARLHEYFWRMYEVEVEKPKDEPKPEPPPPEPPPEPAPVAKAPAPKAVQEDDPYKNLPPPAPAKAGHIEAVERKADDPPELPGFVDGDGTSDWGARSKAGTSDTPTTARNASLHGVPGGKGTAGPVAAAPPPAEDKSRGVQLSGSASWNCPFPPEADADQIDQAVVGVQVTVRPDGSAQSAQVVSGGDHGFGRAAKQCALARRYQPALDRSGTAIVGSGLVNVRFSR